MRSQWHIHQPDPAIVGLLCDRLRCHPVIAALLVNRGFQTVEGARAFLAPTFSTLQSPFAIKDMNAAVQRIYRAIADHQKILVFGDYDVDGVTATAILMDFLRYAGADVAFHIPHRIREGYGLQPRHITEHVLPDHIQLIITADCGSSSHAAVEVANSCGIDVIITDHHSIADDLPRATAVVNPKRSDCPAGMQHLAGVGVAFCLLICLRSYLREKNFWLRQPEPNLKAICDLVALGTVADMVPLVEDNRVFAKAGLQLLSSAHRPGIAGLLEACGVSAPDVRTDDLAYRLAPRLNAAGRLDHAAAAVELLTTDDPATARQIARNLDQLNRRRQEIERQVVDEIFRLIASNPQLLQGKTLVLANSEWHEGILGIVASRLTQRYFRPVVLICTRDGIGKGSARSIPGVDLYRGLAGCGQLLERFGGHTMAAGLTIKADKISEFRQAFEQTIVDQTRPEDWVPALTIDLKLALGDLSDELVDAIEQLAPFGMANPEPLFLAQDVRVAGSKLVGQHHRRMVLQQDSGIADPKIDAIQFNVDPRRPQDEAFSRMAFKVRWNRWNGRKTVQLIVEAIESQACEDQ
jgi:single-stranded-DNA-specific exonuclease